MDKKRILLWAGSAIFAALIAFAASFLWELRMENDILKAQVRELHGALGPVTDGLLRAASKNSQLAGENSMLASNLQAEAARNDAFGNEIKDLSGTVGTLKKLSETDKELLQKYSKVYFLNENYIPSSLATIDTQYEYDPARTEKIHSGVAPFLYAMIAAAARDGVDLKILSAYRSFGEQASLKFGYTVTYGSGANQFSADQGFSEHQLGTTLDFTTPQIKASFSRFASSTAYAWLTANAYHYGFILSYPKDNTYYIFEPWHWRFVGVALATNLHDTGREFYKVDQREIDTYLITIFN